MYSNVDVYARPAGPRSSFLRGGARTPAARRSTQRAPIHVIDTRDTGIKNSPLKKCQCRVDGGRGQQRQLKARTKQKLVKDTRYIRYSSPALRPRRSLGSLRPTMSKRALSSLPSFASKRGPRVRAGVASAVASDRGRLHRGGHGRNRRLARRPVRPLHSSSSSSTVRDIARAGRLRGVLVVAASGALGVVVEGGTFGG